MLDPKIVDEVWESLGGTERFMKTFGYQQFAEEIHKRMATKVEADPLSELTGIPNYVSDAARTLTKWMARNNHKEWKLYGCQNRLDTPILSNLNVVPELNEKRSE